MTSPHVPQSPAGSAEAGTAGDWLTVSTEQVQVDTEWTVTGRLRLRRKIETRTETIQVSLRREILVLEAETVVGDGEVFVGVGTGGPAVSEPRQLPEPVVMVLREEVAQVSVGIQPYQRVTAEVRRDSRQHAVNATVGHEAVGVEQAPAAGQTSTPAGSDVLG